MDGEEFLKHSTTHPKYLESNSTSHSWVFGALAELFDNAQDANATQIIVDVIKNGEHGKMLLVQDNGTGMDYKTLHKMLSFGHCTKQEEDIGRYGNGFKSGSMRMGSDAIVFTKDGTTKSVGMLSRTFLEKTNATEVLVPMVSWSEHTGDFLFQGTTKEGKFMQNSLRVIYEHSPFHSLEDIEIEFDQIEERGTRIMIWNLRNIEGTHKYELEFDHDTRDITLSQALISEDKNTNMDSETNQYMISLRRYLTILYLVPKMKIILRGDTVKTVIYSKTLHLAKSTVYKPKGQNPITMTFGFNPNRRLFGTMIYNKNRLIESFLPLGIMMEHSSRGKGVIAICEADFLQPTHNKQKFVSTTDYNKLKIEIARRLRVYWMALDLHGRIGEFWQGEKTPDEDWLQCDKCLKWRKLGKKQKTLKRAKTFLCSMQYKTPEEQNTACQVPQDEDCIHSKVIFQSHEKETEKIPAGREKWVGARVSLYWASYDKWYEGIVLEYDDKKNKYKIQYDDGDLMWETYDDGFKVLKMPEEKRLRSPTLKRKIAEVSNVKENKTPAKKQRQVKSPVRLQDINRGQEGKSSDQVVEALKKKLSFIVNSLAKQGLITTDFVDLVEEDNVIELDEVKLCESLKVNSNTNKKNLNHVTNNNNSNNNTSNSSMLEEVSEVHNSSRSEMFDANGNALFDRGEEEEFIEYDDEDTGNAETAHEAYDTDHNTPSVARPVPFIQFL